MSISDAEAAVLEALKEGPSYGLELMERVRGLTDGEVAFHQGNVYPLLRSMEREGLLDSFEGEPLPERGGRPRRYYTLTDEGRRVAIENRRALGGLPGLPEPA